MAVAVAVDETIPCPYIGSGEATERLLELAGQEYQTVAASADRLHFARAVRPTWALVTGIILLPIIVGIPLLLVRTTETWVAAIEQDHRRVQVRVTGRVIPSLMSNLVSALSAGPRSAPHPPSSSVYEVVAPGPAIGAKSMPLPSVASGAMQPLAFTHQLPSELTIPELAASGHTKRHTGFAPQVQAPQVQAPQVQAPVAPVVQAPAGSVTFEAPIEERTVLRSSLTASPASSFADVQLPSRAEVGAVTGGSPPPELVAVFDTGERVPLEEGVTVFVGRDPSPIGEASATRLVKIDDTSRSISKTHLTITRVEGCLGVTDLGSTNGTLVRNGRTSASKVLERNEVVEVGAGASVLFGERSFVVEAADGSEGSR